MIRGRFLFGLLALAGDAVASAWAAVVLIGGRLLTGRWSGPRRLPPAPPVLRARTRDDFTLRA